MRVFHWGDAFLHGSCTHGQCATGFGTMGIIPCNRCKKKCRKTILKKSKDMMISRFWFVGPNHPRTDPTGIGLFILETHFDITYSKLKIIVLGSYLDRLWYFTHLTSSASYWDVPIPSQIPSCACRVSFIFIFPNQKKLWTPVIQQAKALVFLTETQVQRFQGPVLDTNQKWPIYKCPITKNHTISIGLL
jgi:hypothetical protein